MVEVEHSAPLYVGQHHGQGQGWEPGSGGLDGAVRGQAFTERAVEPQPMVHKH